MKTRELVLNAVIIGCTVALVTWVFAQWHGALRVVLLLATLVAYIAWGLPLLGVRALDEIIMLARTHHWRREQGRHHAFGGVPLEIHDDGRHVWVEGEGLQRVLGTTDADEVLAARHSGRWRRDPKGLLWLRVDAVADQLAQGAGRLDPRQARLRRYFEREVLFPAAERRRRRQSRA